MAADGAAPITEDMDAPRYNRCDSCWRNAHKVAIRQPIMERNPAWSADHSAPYYRRTGRTEVVGYCPSCCPETIADGSTLVYDRRSERSRAAKPITQPVQVEASHEVNGRRVWTACGHPAERDALNGCYTCRRPLA